MCDDKDHAATPAYATKFASFIAGGGENTLSHTKGLAFETWIIEFLHGSVECITIHDDYTL